jgi:hypothetical protein
MFTEERAQWLYRHYRWLEAQLPQRLEDYKVPLILPTPEFYPMRNTGDHAFAESVFNATRHHMGILDWPCRLTAQSDAERQPLKGVVGETSWSDAAGTFRVGEEIEITYSPGLLRDPTGLVATLAHELCHYLIAQVTEEPPCGWKEHEPLTDLAAVHEGFGVFLCNSAFYFAQWNDHQNAGWQWSSRGYLNEAELGFALGIFCVRGGIDPNQAGRFLKQNPGEVFWDSLDYIADLEKQTPA